MGGRVKWTGKQCQLNFLNHSFYLLTSDKLEKQRNSIYIDTNTHTHFLTQQNLQLMCMDLGWNVHFRLIHPLSHAVILPYLHAFLSWDAHTHVCHLNHTDIIGSITWKRERHRVCVCVRERERERERVPSVSAGPNSLCKLHHKFCRVASIWTGFKLITGEYLITEPNLYIISMLLSFGTFVLNFWIPILHITCNPLLFCTVSHHFI